MTAAVTSLGCGGARPTGRAQPLPPPFTRCIFHHAPLLIFPPRSAPLPRASVHRPRPSATRSRARCRRSPPRRQPRRPCPFLCRLAAVGAGRAGFAAARPAGLRRRRPRPATSTDCPPCDLSDPPTDPSWTARGALSSTYRFLYAGRTRLTFQHPQEAVAQSRRRRRSPSPSMVVFFTSTVVDPPATIYMGKCVARLALRALEKQLLTSCSCASCLLQG